MFHRSYFNLLLIAESSSPVPNFEMCYCISILSRLPLVTTYLNIMLLAEGKNTSDRHGAFNDYLVRQLPPWFLNCHPPLLEMMYCGCLRVIVLIHDYRVVRDSCQAPR